MSAQLPCQVCPSNSCNFSFFIPVPDVANTPEHAFGRVPSSAKPAKSPQAQCASPSPTKHASSVCVVLGEPMSPTHDRSYPFYPVVAKHESHLLTKYPRSPHAIVNEPMSPKPSYLCAAPPTPHHGVAQSTVPGDQVTHPSLQYIICDAPPSHQLTMEQVWYVVLKGAYPGIYLEESVLPHCSSILWLLICLAQKNQSAHQGCWEWEKPCSL